MTAALAAACIVLIGFTFVGAIVFVVAALTDPAPRGAGLDILNP